MLRKRNILISMALVFGMTLFSPVTFGVQPVKAAGGTLTIGTTDSIPTLDPADAYEYWSSNTLEQITHGLYEMPRNSTVAEPVVANSVSVSADGLTYTFTIKSGLKFTDGSAMRVEDIIWSLKRAENLPGDPAFLLGGIVNTSYTKISDTSFSLKLSEKDGTFLQRLTYTNAWIYKEQDNVTDTLQGAGYIPVGLGPYYISKWTQNEQLVLTKSQYYSATALGQPDPTNDQVIIQFFTNSANLKTAIEGGTIDVAFHSFTPDEINTLEANADLNHASAPTVGIRYLVINVQNITDKSVRQAMSLAVNRSDFTQSIFSGTNDPLYSMVPAGFANACHEGDACAFPDSPNQAQVKTLMEGAGYSTTNKYSFDLWYDNSGHYGDTEADVANLMKTQLEGTGYFSVNLKSTTWADYKTKWGHIPAFLLGWWFDYPDESNYIDPFVGGGAFDLGTNYSSTTMNGYITNMLESSDASVRATAQKNAQQLMATDVPVVPLFTMIKQFVVYSKAVTGVTLEPSENMHFDSFSKSAASPGYEFYLLLMAIPVAYAFKKKYRKNN